MFLSSASHTMFREIEQLVAGRIASMQVVGFYSVTKGLSSIFTEEIATALNRVTFVITARDGRTLSEQPERLSVMLGSYAMIAALFGLGLASTAGDACVVLLGPKWAGAAPYLRFVGPGAACFGCRVDGTLASVVANRDDFFPESLCLTARGLFITDSKHGKVYRYSRDEGLVAIATFGGTLANVQGIAIDPAGNIYLSVQTDLHNRRGYILRLNQAARPRASQSAPPALALPRRAVRPNHTR